MIQLELDRGQERVLCAEGDMEELSRQKEAAAQEGKGNDSAKAGKKAKIAAYGVCEDTLPESGPPRPGHFHFYLREGVDSVSVPKEQDAAREVFESVANTMRVTLQKDQPILFNEHFASLLRIAQGVFSGDGFVPQGMSEVERLKTAILHAAGGHLKSAYLKRMLISCVVTAAVVLLGSSIVYYLTNWSVSAGFVLAETNQENASILHTGVLLAFSMVGLFFASALRNIEPTFETLQTPDADLVPPWLRVVFYGIAVFLLSMVFQAKIVTVTIGTFSSASIGENYTTAIIIGLLLGIAERALPKEVLYWAKEVLTRSRRSNKSSYSGR